MKVFVGVGMLTIFMNVFFLETTYLVFEIMPSLVRTVIDALFFLPNEWNDFVQYF